MTPLRLSVDYQPLAPLRLDGARMDRSSSVLKRHILFRGLFTVVALALPALGTRIAGAPAHLPGSGAVQTAVTLGPSPTRVAAVRLP